MNDMTIGILCATAVLLAVTAGLVLIGLKDERGGALESERPLGICLSYVELWRAALFAPELSVRYGARLAILSVHCCVVLIAASIFAGLRHV